MMASGRHLLTVLVTVCFLSAAMAQKDLFTQVYPEEGGFSVPGCTNQKMDLILMLDCSENETALQAMKTVANNLVQFANPDNGFVRVGVVAYSSEVSRVIDLSEFSRTVELVSAISSLQLQPGDRNTAGGLQAMKRLFQTSSSNREDAPDMAILLSTGNSVLRANEVSKEAREARDQGVDIFAIAVGVTDENEIKDIVSSPSDETKFLVDNVADLAFLPDIVFAQICIRLQSQVVDDLRVEGPMTDEMQDEAGLTADNSRQVDVAVVFHAQTSTNARDIENNLKPFIKNLFRYADIDGGNVRASVSYFRKNPTHVFPLKKHKTRQSFQQGIDAIDSRRVRGRKNDGGSALADVRTSVFSARRGDRTNVPNAVIFITDNKVNISPKKLDAEARALKATGASLITVGVGKANRAELRSAASDPQVENAFYFRSYADLRNDASAKAIRNRIYALQNLPPPTKPPPQVTTTARVVSQVGLAGSSSADLVFALHFNPRGSEEDFRRLTRWLQNLAESADIDSGNVRMGMYVDDQYMPFQLNTFQSSQELVETLKNLPKRVARARNFNLVSTLRNVRERMFTAPNGDRPDVPNGLVIITDTNSRDNRRRVQQETTQMAQAGIDVFTVGVGLGDKGEMETVASSSRNVFAASDYRELETNVHSLRGEIKALGPLGGIVSPGKYM